jgi:hypothetical protein
MKIFITYGIFFLCFFAYFCNYFIRLAIQKTKNANKTNEKSDVEIKPNKNNNHHMPKIKITHPKWIKPGESIVILGKEIIHGNFYFGNKIKSSCCSSLDLSLIDDNLSITASDKKYTDHSTYFYPKFSLLSPKCKGAYIDWLASDRTDTDIPMCYIFIYFYGLEHRVIFDYYEDLIDDNEYRVLFNEINTLRLLFSNNTILYRKATCLMEWMAINKPRLLQMPISNLALIKNSLFFKYTLSLESIRRKPISSDLALAWLWQSQNYKFNKKIIKEYSIFTTIFKKQYYKQFGEGMLVSSSNKKLDLTYKTSLNTTHSLPINLPKARRTKKQLFMLANIADTCTASLLQTNI